MSSHVTMRRAVNIVAGTASTTAAIGLSPFAWAADTATPDAASPNPELQELVVTGTRIRRDDVETANAVFVIDNKQIQDSGYNTVGELMQRIPSISGAATSPNLSTNGGFGEQTIELRGLEAKRTLILVDGRRLGVVGAADAIDVNQIPINLIDHIEVLKEGAGAIYGSDAVGGVVNFITRKNVDGVEIGADYGQTTKHDGAQHGANLIFGKTVDNFSFEAGGDYFQQKAVYSGARGYSKYALYLYGGTSGVVQSGSSKTPTGRISIPNTGPLQADFGCGSVTRVGPLNGIGGAPGTSLSDYRCFTGPDHFNYEPFTLITTPVERTQAFTKVSYEINDYATAYSNFTYNHTHSGSEQAPLGFDAQVDDIVISKNNIYNPFGIDFGGLSGANEDALLRLSGLGDRVFTADTNTTIANVGVRGKTGLTDWNYDVNFGYNQLYQQQSEGGYYFKPGLQNAVGPSFYANPATGAAVPAGTPGAIPTCGVPGTPISNCTPLNIFNIFAPSQAAVLNTLAATVVNNDSSAFKSATLDFNGSVWKLPAGDLKGAFGFAYQGTEGEYTPSSLAVASPPLYLQCQVSNEACTGPSQGAYNSKDEYVEMFVPILKDLPGVQQLDLDAGVRHSSYSLFGSTTKSDLKIEYRPVKDVLVRGTWAQVYRVPTITDLYAAPVNNSSTFNDPCVGLTTAKIASNPNLALACKGVPTDGSFTSITGALVTAVSSANPNLKPESGLVRTVGIVFDPSFLPGFSIDLDYWIYKLNNVITLLDSNYSIGQCVSTGNPTFCNYANRYQTGPQAGQIEVFDNPTSNLGALTTDGVDLSIHYTKRGTRIGNFQFSADVTDTMSYLNTPFPGAAPQQIAGTFNKQFGNFARFRGLATAGWSGWGAEALITAQYINHLLVTDPSVLGATATGATYPPLYIGSVVYWNMSVGYTLPTKTKLLLSMQNIFDKQPPIFYINNVTNANTDVATYDTLGRRFLVSLMQKF
jgi:outer membrane receptor protein involved in Fe transport